MTDLTRLEALRELVLTLRPVVTAIDSDKAMGTAGLVGQYRAALAEIEQLEAAQAKREATPFDQIAAKRAAKSSAGQTIASRGRQ